MDALPDEQQSSLEFEEAYSRLLGSLSPFLPFDAYSNKQVVKQAHDNCKLRLQNMLRLFDTELSPRCFTHISLIRLQNDFLENIYNITDAIPDEFFDDKDIVFRSLLDVADELALAIDTRKPAQGNLTTKKIRAKNAKCYKCLNTCTSRFEQALKHWECDDPSMKRGPLRPDRTVQGQIYQQRSVLNDINVFLNKPFQDKQPKSITNYESYLRTIITSLSKIPDELAQFYLPAKNKIIEHLRTLKILLNLALDEFKLIEQKGLDRDILYDYFKKSIISIKDAKDAWDKK